MGGAAFGAFLAMVAIFRATSKQLREPVSPPPPFEAKIDFTKVKKETSPYRSPQMNEGIDEIRAKYDLPPLPPPPDPQVLKVILPPPPVDPGPVVIKTAPATYQTECDACHCTFEYKYAHTSPPPSGGIFRRVKCPGCGATNPHT
jgi:hypothetical protein